MTLRKRPLLAVVMIAVVVLVAAVAFAQMSRPSPVAVVPSGVGTPAPTAPPTPSPTPTSVRVLHADGMATVAAPGALPVWSAPGGAKAKVLKPPLAAGAVVFLTRGPRRVAGIDWWELQADYTPALPSLFGWVPARGTTNAPTLVPFAPACPATDAPLDSRFIKDIGTLQALACFGHSELTLQGMLSCYDAAVDSAVGGASWLATNYSCSMVGPLWLEGPVIAGLEGRPIIGRYEVRGHFDDPEAAACSWIPFGTSLLTPSGHPDPGAVIACRQSFVVTAATKLDQGPP